MSDDGNLTPVHIILLLINPDSPNSSHKDDPDPYLGDRESQAAAFPSLRMMHCLAVLQISEANCLFFSWIYKRLAVGH